MKFKKLMILCIILLVIQLAGLVYSQKETIKTHYPFNQLNKGDLTTYELNSAENSPDNNNIIVSLFSDKPKEKDSPYDRIGEDNIHVYNDRIVIDLKDAEWASFTDTNSMDPVIDDGANALQIIPRSADEIHVGDIISYDSEYADGTIIHRVIEKGEDDEGIFFRAKGDNNPDKDPGKIRFNQTKRVLVAIIY